jgi:hypothetical protein
MDLELERKKLLDYIASKKFDHAMISIIRRIYPNEIARVLTSVQSMKDENGSGEKKAS